jgi:hypothetical protein
MGWHDGRRVTLPATPIYPRKIGRIIPRKIGRWRGRGGELNGEDSPEDRSIERVGVARGVPRVASSEPGYRPDSCRVEE